MNEDLVNDTALRDKEKELVFGQDYLYVCDVTDSFNEAYSALNSGKPFMPGTLYKTSDGKVASVVQ